MFASGVVCNSAWYPVPFSKNQVKIVFVKDTHMFLLLCCDGLFEPNVFTTSSLTIRARELMEEHKAPLEVSKTLCREAISRGSQDNVSVLTVLFTAP